MSLSHITMIDFPQHLEAELRIQLGKLLPDTRIEAQMANSQQPVEAKDGLILIWDNMTSPALVRRLFDSSPQANVVILTDNGNADRAADLMHLGAIDYRLIPVPDDVLAGTRAHWPNRPAHNSRLKKIQRMPLSLKTSKHDACWIGWR